jgi:hypothetical protein
VAHNFEILSLIYAIKHYIGRSDHAKRPFRFLLNNTKATATNVYLCLYPQPLLAQQLALYPDALRLLWEGLNSISKETLLGNGRVYGGGMHKLEPKELANVPVDDLAALMGLSAKHKAVAVLSKAAKRHVYHPQNNPSSISINTPEPARALRMSMAVSGSSLAK